MSLIASIAKGLALHGQGDTDGAIDAFGSVLCSCDNNVKRFVECIKVRYTFTDIMQLVNIMYLVHRLSQCQSS